MTDIRALRLRIQKLLFNGDTQLEVFEQTYSQFSNQSMSATRKDIYKMFKNKCKNRPQNFPQEFLPLIKMIKTEHSKYKLTLNDQMCPNGRSCHLQYVSQRYALELHKVSDQKGVVIHLYDLLHEKKMKLQIERNPETKIDHCDLTLLDSERFFVFYHDYTTGPLNYVTIQLMQLDLTKMTCKTLDTTRVIYNHVSLTINSPSQFIFKIYDDGNYFYQRGQIIDSKIEIDAKLLESIEPPEDPHCSKPYDDVKATKLEGDKLFEIKIRNNYEDFEEDHFEYTSPPSLFKYYESIIGAEKVECKKLFDFDGNSVFLNNDSISVKSFLWTENVCYIAGEGRRCLEHGALVYKFDLDDRTVRRFKFIKYYCYPGKMYHENGVLSVCVVNRNNLQHLWHRIPTGQPDTLTQLTMKILRQRMAFMERRTYYKFIQLLPVKLRPFEK
ncbi:hypothetical protein M3Y97_01147800 [Aphelenchoides bicaudatus]|nr:hypothetical protein M3Y97_01147800 [Aphelenchoides bicaudatus]